MKPLVWSYIQPVRIYAGPGIVSRVSEYVPQDKKILLVTTPGFTRRGVAHKVLEYLGKDRTIVFDEVAPNPELNDLECYTANFRDKNIDVIVALGGGSVIDTAKVLSISLCCKAEMQLRNVLLEGDLNKWHKNLPVIAIPTTSGTGAEVTPFATVWDSQTQKKLSLSGEQVTPKLAILDPELTIDLPSKTTLYTSLDTISHALESIWNINCTPLTKAIAVESLTIALNALPSILEQPKDIQHRAEMQNASVLAGLAISQTRTAIAHSISYPLTIHYGVPHGLACSFSLEKIINHYLSTYPDDSTYELLSNVKNLLEQLELHKHLSSYLSHEQVLALKDEMLTPGRSGNYCADFEDITEFL